MENVNPELAESSLEKKCLNCENPLSGKYCSNCGQKASTQRITFKRILVDDILHGAFHFEKGMLFTARETLLRPGKSALDYISGKRKRFYNVFLLTLLLIALNILLMHNYSEFHLENISENEIKPNELGVKLENLIRENRKIYILLFIPFSSFLTFILFGRKKLNYSEHAIVAAFLLAGTLIISAISILLSFADLVPSIRFLSYFDDFSSSIFFGYISYTYYRVFGKDYSFFGFCLRILFFGVTMIIAILTLFVIVYGFISNWDFGELIV